MIRARSFCIWCMTYLFAVSAAGSESTSYLPVNHRVYDFLERMDHLFYISGTYLGTRPLTRAEAARLLFSLKEKSHTLSTTDVEELACLRDEFKADFIERSGLVWDDRGPVEKLPGFLSGFLYRNRRNLFSSYGDGYSLFCDPIIVRKGTIGTLHGSSGDDNVYTASNGLRIRGTVGEHIGFFADVRDSKVWGSRDYPEKTANTLPGIGFASFKGDHAEFDETHAHITYSGGPFVIFYGRGQNLWGRGKSSTLGLSGYGAPYDMLRFETAFWRLKFVFFASEIEQYPPVAKFYYHFPGTAQDSVVVQKRLSGNRLELDLTDRINLGFYEAVVYGGRWDLSYLNPLMFLKGAEHANGDHDNAVMGMDFRIFVHRAHSIYGEFFIDDIYTTKLGTDWYGNKLAGQIGSYLVDPFGLFDTDMRVEYTRISPWVYTHRLPINTFTNYGDVMGHPMGPNSDEIFVEFCKRFSRRLHTSLAFSSRRHGNNPEGKNVGGDPLLGFKQGDSEKAFFLAGDVVRTRRVSFDVSYEVLWEFFVKFGYTYENMDGDGINIFRGSVGLNE